jgi:hypothetical protein
MQTNTNSASQSKSVGADDSDAALPHECEECGDSFATKIALRGHQSKHSEFVESFGRPAAEEEP